MSDYQQLSEAELREYVKRHPEDEDAFQYYLSIVRAKPGVLVTTEEEALAEFKKRLASETIKNDEYEQALYAARIFSEYKHKNIGCWLVEKNIFERIQFGETPPMYKGCSNHQTGVREKVKIVSGDNGYHEYSVDDAVLIARMLEQLGKPTNG